MQVTLVPAFFYDYIWFKMKQEEIKIFEESKVLSIWDAAKEQWYFSIVDIIKILTDSPNPRKYWSVLKTRLKAEGSQLTKDCSQLEMKAADGKLYLSDVLPLMQTRRFN